MDSLSRNLAAVFVFFFSHILEAQTVSPSVGDTQNVIIPTDLRAAKFFKQKSPPPPGTKGSPLLFSEKRTGVIYSPNFGMLKDYFFNYNVNNNNFEIHTDQGIRILGEVFVDSFEVFLPTYEVETYIKLDSITSKAEATLIGFGKIIKRGREAYIVEVPYVYIQKPNYNMATNTGEKDKVIKIKKEQYLINHTKAYLIPLNKTQLAEIFGKDLGKFKQEAKAQNLKLSKKEGLLWAIDFLK